MSGRSPMARRPTDRRPTARLFTLRPTERRRACRRQPSSGLSSPPSSSSCSPSSSSSGAREGASDGPHPRRIHRLPSGGSHRRLHNVPDDEDPGRFPARGSKARRVGRGVQRTGERRERVASDRPSGTGPRERLLSHLVRHRLRRRHLRLMDARRAQAARSNREARGAHSPRLL